MALAPQAEILARLTLMADCNPLVKPAASMCDDGASTTSGGTDMEPSSLPPSPNELFSLPEDSTSASEDYEPSRADHNGFPSVGSIGHFSGQCTRCCFHPKWRCLNGYDCNFCHFDHDKRRRLKKMDRFQAGVYRKLSYMGLNTQQIQHSVSPSMPPQSPPGLVPSYPQTMQSTMPRQPAPPPPPMPCATPSRHASWTSEQVANWLNMNDLGHLASVFMAHRITGDVLLDLTSNDLVEIGVQALGDRKRFLRAAAQFQSPSSPAVVCPPRGDVYPGDLIIS